MKHYDIIFLSLAQNCSNHLSKFFSTLDELNKTKSVYSIIGENGSNDFTLDKILKYSYKNNNLEFVDTTFIESSNNRVERLGMARQKLKDLMIKQNLKCSYVCVVDLDDVLNINFNRETILNSIEKLEDNKNKYFAISSKSKPYYYDILNFSTEELRDLQIIDIQSQRNFSSYYYRKKYIYNNQVKFTKKTDFDAISAFNGMCIYLFKDFLQGNYFYYNEKKVVPEHLRLNKEIFNKTNRKILVSNDIILNTPIEHLPSKNILDFIITKIIKYFKIIYNKIHE